MATNNSSFLSLGRDQHVFDIPHVRALFIVLYTIIFIFCTFGNLAVVLVVIFHSRMRNTTKFLLGNLAFANLCVGIFCVYQSLTTYLYESWLYGDLMCKMHYFTQSLCHAASILILVAIAVERYLVLLHPFKSRQLMTLGRLVALITTLWICSATIASPRLYYFGTIKIPLRNHRNKDTICIPKKTLYDSAMADTIYFVLLYVFPLTVITILYARIAQHLHRSVALRTGLNQAGHQYRISLSRRRPELSVHYDGTGSVRIRSVRLRRQSSISEGYSWRKRRSVSFSSSTSTSGRCSTTDSERQLCSKGRRKFLWRLPVYKPRSKPRNYTCVTFISPSSLRRKVPQSQHQDDETQMLTRFRNSSTKRSSWPDCHARSCIGRSRSDSVLVKNNFSGKHERIEGIVGSGTNVRIYRRTGTLRSSTSGYVYRHRLQVSAARFQLNQRLYAIRVLIVLVMTFALLNLPFHVRKLCLNYLPSYDADSDVNHLLTPFTFLLMYANCAISPVLYAFLNKKFRRSFLDLFFMWRKQRRGGRRGRVP